MKLAIALPVVVASLAANLFAQTLTNYQAVVTSQSPSNYFKLDGSLESAVNGSVVLLINDALTANGGFRGDVFHNPTNSYYFDAAQNNAWLRNTTDPLINGGGISNNAASAKGSISFVFRTLAGVNTTGERWLFDATSTATDTTNHNTLSLYFANATTTNSPNSLKLLFGDSTTVILPASNILHNTWYYFAVTYDEARETNSAVWYLGPAGGLLSTGMTTNSDDSVAGGGNGLYIGQRASFGGAFRNPGAGRVDEFAIWGRELTVTEISNQFAALPQPLAPGLTYQEVVEAHNPMYYFKLDNSFVESVGNSLVLSTNGTNGAFTSDFLGNASSAYTFSETNDALYITNDLINGGGVLDNPDASGVGTITFQFRMLSETTNTGQRFLFSAPGSEGGLDNNALSLFLEDNAGVNPNSLKLRFGGITYGNSGSSTPTNNVPIAYSTNLVTNAWYYFALLYDELDNGITDVYFGRAGAGLVKIVYNPNDNNVVGDNGWLVIGNMIQSNSIVNRAFRNPGEGVIDEFAIWHDMLSPAEIQAQFDAMVSIPVDVTLNIVRQGNNVVLSWMAAGTAGFELESTPSLSAPSWTGAGTPTLVGTNNVVTNATAGRQFYRLRK
jgi:hypothetical protein